MLDSRNGYSVYSARMGQVICDGDSLPHAGTAWCIGATPCRRAAVQSPFARRAAAAMLPVKELAMEAVV